MGGSITIAQLQRAHAERQDEWCPDQKPDLSFRGNEMAGEVGEACNVIKKLERERHGWRGSRATIDDLGDELADTIHTAILCAITAGIDDLEARVVSKFNATSEKNGLGTRLSAIDQAPAEGESFAWAPQLEYRWYYASSEDAEYYPGSNETRDAAKEEAEDHYAGDEELNEETGRWELSFALICGAKEPLRLSAYLSLDAALEQAEEAILNGEQVTEDDDGPFFEPTPDQERDLERRIRAACDEWQIAHSIYPMTRCVTSVTDSEEITIDVTEARLAAEAAKAVQS